MAYSMFNPADKNYDDYQSLMKKRKFKSDKYFLPLEAVEAARLIANSFPNPVSQQARSQSGFATWYRKWGGRIPPSTFPSDWEKWLGSDSNNTNIGKRRAFNRRHLAQILLNDEPLYEDGMISRRHLALVIWAYSPQPLEFLDWLNEYISSSDTFQGKRKKVSKNPFILEVKKNSPQITTLTRKNNKLLTDKVIDYE